MVQDCMLAPEGARLPSWTSMDDHTRLRSPGAARRTLVAISRERWPNRALSQTQGTGSSVGLFEWTEVNHDFASVHA